MKRYGFLVLFCIISTLIFPSLIYMILSAKSPVKNETAQHQETIDVYFSEEDAVRTMGLDEYLYGVVGAEMPASFETEALKAQAVAARSYAVYKKENPSSDHKGADVCTDYMHCKAYKEKEELESSWGSEKKIYSKKIKEAVESTSGEIITYGGEVALAVFHSQSGGGRTENSKDVWGGDVPYLVSVESHGEENAPGFFSEVTVDFYEFRDKIKSENPEIVITSASDIGEIELNEGGSVKSILIGNKAISGKDIRRIFNLRSSCFKINTDGETVKFEVTGYGHGVGMSQYGANAMAKEGKTYKDILMHYYSGTQIEGV